MKIFSTFFISFLISLSKQGVTKHYELDCSYKESTIQLIIEMPNNSQRHCYCLPVTTQDSDPLITNKDRYCRSKICQRECDEVDFRFVCHDPLCFCNLEKSEASTLAELNMSRACPTIMNKCNSHDSCHSDDNQRCDFADQKCVCKSGYKNLYGECSDDFCYSEYDHHQCSWPSNLVTKFNKVKQHVKIKLFSNNKKYTPGPTTTMIYGNFTTSHDPFSNKLQWWTYLIIVMTSLLIICSIILLIYKLKIIEKIKSFTEPIVAQDESKKEINIFSVSYLENFQEKKINEQRTSQDIENFEKQESVIRHDNFISKDKLDTPNLKEKFVKVFQDNIEQCNKVDEFNFFLRVFNYLARRNRLEIIDLESDDTITNRIINKYFKLSLPNPDDYIIVQCGKITKKEDEEVHRHSGFYDDPNSFMLWYITSMADIQKIFESGISDHIYLDGLNKSDDIVFYDQLDNLKDKIDDDGYALLLLCRVSMGNM